MGEQMNRMRAIRASWRRRPVRFDACTAGRMASAIHALESATDAACGATTPRVCLRRR